MAPSTAGPLQPVQPQQMDPRAAAAAVLNVAELKAALASFRSDVEGWAAGKAGAADALRQENDVNLRNTEATLRELGAREKQLEAGAEELKQRLEEEQEEAAALREELQLVDSDRAAGPARLAALASALAGRRAELAAQAAALQQDKAAKEAKLAALHEANAVYRDRLGLRFEQGEDEELRFVFTLIDAAQPSRPFAFTVKVLPGPAYAVLRCEPPLPRLAGLVQKLNAAPDDFGGFVRAARRAFQELALAQG